MEKLQKIDFIVVDDDPMSTFLTSELLSDHPICKSISNYKSGSDCLQKLLNNTDTYTILLDINMPLMNAWEFLKEYRSLLRNDQIILLTSSINEDDRLRAMSEHVGFLNKPLNTDELLQILS